MRQKRQAMLFILAASLLSGCFGPKPEEELYTVFESAVSQEEGLQQHAAGLEALEKKSHELYGRILQEGKEDGDRAQASIEQALQVLAEREDLMKKELQLLEASQKKMTGTKEMQKKLKEASLEKQAHQVETLYKERYDAFFDMYNAYIQALASEKKLYQMLQGKKDSIKMISDQVKLVNQAQKQVAVQRDMFNTYTKQYNQEKVDFYQKAGIQIQE